jgi:hypothetical protein
MPNYSNRPTRSLPGACSTRDYQMTTAKTSESEIRRPASADQYTNSIDVFMNNYPEQGMVHELIHIDAVTKLLGHKDGK